MSTNWLAIDTATDVASVALGAPARTVTRTFRGARMHAAQILLVIRDVLEEAQVRPAQLSGIVVGDGPGSFTGLRIAWAAAKGLAQERGLPLIAIPSMLGAAHAVGVETVGACYDALRGQIFGAVYAFQNNEVKTLVAPDVTTIPALADRVRRAPDVAVGDGAERYREQVTAWTGRAPVGIEALPPIAGSLLALLAYDGARSPVDAKTGEPAYGRPAEAQAKWESRHGRPFRIRPARLGDVPHVHAIERAVFSDPWSLRDFEGCIASEAAFLVAETADGKGVAGYVVALDAADEGEILNLAVAPDGRRRGLGRALVAAVLAELTDRGAHNIYLEVRESNAAARALYAAHGFGEVGRRPGYYRRPVEDAIVLRVHA